MNLAPASRVCRTFVVMVVFSTACSRASVAVLAPPSTPTGPLAATQASPSPTAAIDTPSPSPSPSPTPPLTPSPARLTRGPYLQSVTAASITVVWDTDIPTRGQVQYGELTAAAVTATDPADGTHHALTLDGLKPYTRYRYRVLDAGWPLSADYVFRTAARENQSNFNFVVFGDTRTGHEIHQSIVDRIAALSPDFVLHTGDLVDNGLSQADWDRFFHIEAPLMAETSLFPSLGNHEANSPLYFDLFHLPGNGRWYSFDYGDAHFISLEIDAYARFGTTSEQYAWLETDLATNSRPWSFVFFHIPPYSSLSEDDAVLAVRRNLTPLFQKYGVDMVFTGHHHEYQRREVDGITYIVTGGGGAEIYPIVKPDPALLAFANEHHFIAITMDGNGLHARVIAADGRELDRFDLARP